MNAMSLVVGQNRSKVPIGRKTLETIIICLNGDLRIKSTVNGNKNGRKFELIHIQILAIEQTEGRKY